MQSNNSGVRNTHFKKNQVFELLLDVKFWTIFVISACCLVANGPISTFIPIIINSLGFSTLNSLLLLMPVGAYAGLTMLLAPYFAYRFQNIRSYIFFVCEMGTLLAALLLWLLPRHALGGLLFACIILPTNGAGFPVLMGLALANTAGYTKRSLMSSGMYMGYCVGNIIGPLVYLPKEAPRYPTGFTVVVATAIAAAVLVIVYRFICVWENNRRDKSGTMEGFDHAYEDDLTDKSNPQFRYLL